MFCSLNGSIARLSFLLLSIISIAACDSVENAALPVNEAPTASSVSITDNNDGIFLVGETLTGNYIYADTEGNAEGVSSYRWFRNGAIIGGATTSSYTLKTVDIGQSITFEVTPVASIGTANGNPKTSSAITVNTPPTASNITISGDTTVGSLLTASYTYADVDGDPEGITTFRWLRDGIAIPGATTLTYTLAVVDINKPVTFAVTPVAATGAIIGNTVISAGGITANNSAPFATNVSITNTSAVVGDTLIGSYTYNDIDGDLQGTSRFSWLRDGLVIGGETAQFYEVVAADSGQIITFEVTPIADTGSTDGLAVITPIGITVANSAPVFTSPAIITATENAFYSYTPTAFDADGDTVTFSNVSSPALPGWLTLSAGVLSGTPGNDDVGSFDVVLRVTDDDTSPLFTEQSFTITVTNVNDLGSVSISGTTTEDQTLTATVSDIDGVPASIAYQWKANNVNIGGATASTYVLTQAEVGKTITATATYTDTRGGIESPTSSPTGLIVNVNDPGSVSISGTVSEGETLTATVSDLDGVPVTIVYQWKAAGANIGINSKTYVLTQAEVGKTITVLATYTDNQGGTESPTSASTGAVTNVNNAGSVSINGTVSEDETLTATVTDVDGISGAITYQWQAGGANIGTNSNTYVLTQAEVGEFITVTASYTDDGLTSEIPAATTTTTVENVNDLGSVIIGGITTEDQTLTATVSDLDGVPVTIIYQWKAGTTLIGTNSKTYLLTQAEVGKAITVTATYTDTLGGIESPLSSATAAIANVNDPASVSISGTVLENETLTAAVTDADGISGAITYQWQAGGATIGTNSNTYVLTQAEVGKFITVTASYTDNGNTSETPTATTTTTVTNVNNTGSVSISDITPTQGQTLTATVSDADGVLVSIAYQWKANTIAISGATNSTYLLKQAEVDKNITVTASYTDNQGGVENPTSDPTTAVVNVNDAPTVANAIADVTVAEDAAPTNIDISSVFADVDIATNTDSLNYSVVSSDGTLVSASITGTTLTLTYAAGQSGVATITVTATDTNGPLAVADSFTVTVTFVNDAPTVESVIPAQVLLEDFASYTINLNTAFADAETADAALVYSVTGNTNINVSIAANGIATITPTANWNGSETLTFIATDTGTPGLSVNQAVLFTVNPVNDAPTVANAIADVTVAESATPTNIDISSVFADVDIATNTDSLNYSVVSSDGTLVSASITGTTLTLTYAAGQSGVATITVTATDTNGPLAVADSFTVTVTFVNDAPTVESVIPAQVLLEDFASYTINLNTAFADAETADAALVYSVTGNTNINVSIAANGIATITPTANWNGSETLTFIATDTGTPGLSVNQAVLFTVNPVNDAPTVANAIADVTVAESATPTNIDISSVFADVDIATNTDSLNYSVVSSDVTLVSVSITGTTLTLTYAAGQNGVATITVTATDTNGPLAVADPFTVTVTSVNDAPTVANAIADVTVAEDATPTIIDISSVFADVDIATNADSLTYSVLSSDVTLVSASITGTTLTLTYAAGQNGVATITVTATDTNGPLAVADPFTVTVTSVNDAPTVETVIPDQTLSEDFAIYTIDLNAAFADTETADAALVYNVSGNTNINVTIAASGIATITPTVNWNGNETLTFSATDTGTPGLSVNQVVLFTVNPINDAPTVANAIADVTVDEDATPTIIDISSVFADVDIATDADSLTYSVLSSDGTLVSASITGTTLTLTYAAGQNGVATITVTATDTNGPLAVADPFTVTVTSVNDAPTVETVIPDQTLSEDFAIYTIDLNAAFADTETADAALVYNVSGNTNINVTIAASGIATITPTVNWNGNETLTFSATDTGTPGLSVNQVVLFTVNPINDAPTVANAIADVTVAEDATPTIIDISSVFADADIATDADSLTYSVLSSDVTLVSASITGTTLTLTYAAGQNGVATITVTATDTNGPLAVADPFTVTVTSVNDAPTVANAIADVTVVEDATPTIIDISSVFADADIATDADSLTYSVLSSDVTLVSASITGTTLTLTYVAGQSGVATITVTATDTNGPLAVADSFTITVTAAMAEVISTSSPVVTGFARYLDINKNAINDANDQLIVPFDQDVNVNTVVSSDFDLPVIGDTFGTGATVVAGPASNEVTVILGTSPNFKTRQDFSIGVTTANSASGIDVAALMMPEAIEGTSGLDAVSSTPIDLIPAFVDSLQSLGANDSSSVILGDIDGDLDLDMVVANAGTQGNRVYINTAGSFSDSGQSLGTNDSQSIILGDIDGDLDLDMVVANAGTQGNRVYINTAGIFTDSGQSLGANDSRTVILADVDGDADLDMVVANAGTQGNRVYINTAGIFTDSGQSLGTNDSQSIILGDIDGDADLDMVVANAGTQGNRVYINTAGIFTDSGQSLGTNDSQSIILGDIDGDADLDMVVANAGTQGNRVYINTAGIFTDSGQSLGANDSRTVILADVDGDADLDMVVANAGTQGNRVYINTAGSFTDSGQSLGANDSQSIILGDVDGDGDLDMVVVNFAQTNNVYLNSLSGTWGL